MLFRNLKAVRIPGTEDMDPEYRAFGFHLAGFLKGIFIGAGASLIVASVFLLHQEEPPSRTSPSGGRLFLTPRASSARVSPLFKTPEPARRLNPTRRRRRPSILSAIGLEAWRSEPLLEDLPAKTVEDAP